MSQIKSNLTDASLDKRDINECISAAAGDLPPVWVVGVSVKSQIFNRRFI